MKNLIATCLSALLLLGCDNTVDYFYGLNKSPELVISLSGQPVINYNDSIKIGFSRTFSYSVVDEENLSVSLDNPEGGLAIAKGNGQFVVTANNPGAQKVIVSTSDSFGASSSASLSFTSFTNLVPIARFSLLKIAEKEIEVDARESFDKDNRFGGAIVEYEYDMNGYIFKTSLPLVRYIFGTIGQKKIRVRVRDNSNAWGEWVEKFILV